MLKREREGKKKIATLIFVPSYALVTPLPPPLHCDRGLVGGGGEWRGGLLFSSISPENPRPDSKYVRYCVVYYWFGLFIIHTLSTTPPPPNPPPHTHTHLSLSASSFTEEHHRGSQNTDTKSKISIIKLSKIILFSSNTFLCQIKSDLGDAINFQHQSERAQPMSAHPFYSAPLSRLNFHTAIKHCRSVKQLVPKIVYFLPRIFCHFPYEANTWQQTGGY